MKRITHIFSLSLIVLASTAGLIWSSSIDLGPSKDASYEWPQLYRELNNASLEIASSFLLTNIEGFDPNHCCDLSKCPKDDPECCDPNHCYAAIESIKMTLLSNNEEIKGYLLRDIHTDDKNPGGGPTQVQWQGSAGPGNSYWSNLGPGSHQNNHSQSGHHGHSPGNPPTTEYLTQEKDPEYDETASPLHPTMLPEPTTLLLLSLGGAYFIKKWKDTK